MTQDPNDTKALTEAFSSGAAELESSLSEAMKSIGEVSVKRPEIVRALASAEQLQPGYVISSEEQAAEVADLVAQIISGERTLADQVRLALAIPKAMEAALKGAVAPTKDALQKAREAGNAARVAYQNTLRRQAAELEARRRQEAEEAAREAAAMAAEGEDVPPPVEVAPVEVPRTVQGGTGKMGTMVTIVAVEIVDHAVCPYDWMFLATAKAREAFLAAGMKVHVEPGGSIVWKGVRFEARESAVNRR